jgi:hypothetical protein
MSTTPNSVRPEAHRITDPEDTPCYEATGLWTGSLPEFVDSCAEDGEPHLERRGDRTFVVVD